MKQRWVVVAIALLCMMGQVAMAVELPADIAAVFASERWAGYEPVASSAFGGTDTSPAQIAVLMKQGDHNVICLLERMPDDSEYMFYLLSDTAVLQGDALPSLLIDTGGDALYYTYHFEEGDVEMARYWVFKSFGQWGNIGVDLYYRLEDGRRRETGIHEDRDVLYYDELFSDENDNIVERGASQVIKGAWIDTKLAMFDIQSLPWTYEEALALYGTPPYAEKLLHSQTISLGGRTDAALEIWGIQSEESHEWADVMYVKGAGALLQEIPLGHMEWGWGAASMIRVEDANFDGAVDLLVCNSIGSARGVFGYDVWLWDEASGMYAESALYTALAPLPEFHPEDRTIRCTEIDGIAYTADVVYRVDADGVPQLVEKTERETDAEGRVAVTKWTWNGEAMEKVDEWTE